MSNRSAESGREPNESNLTPWDEEIVEFSLLLPGWQAAALEASARGQGMTTGQMVRRLIQDFFSRFAQPRHV